MKSSIIVLAMMLAAAQPAIAGPCDVLRPLAQANGGGWPQIDRLPQKTAEDGPWYLPSWGWDEKTLGTFHPRLQAARARLLAEAGTVDPGDLDPISSYLAPTQSDFAVGKGMENYDFITIHRWAAVPIFALGAHMPEAGCETNWTYFYNGEDGKVHVARPTTLDPCDSPATNVSTSMAMIRNGSGLALMNETFVNDATEGKADLTQDIATWNGRGFDPVCTLTYYHHIGYKISDQTRFEDDHGRARPPTPGDRWLLANAVRLVPEYLKQIQATQAFAQQQPKSGNAPAHESPGQIAALNAHARLDLLKARKLISAYDALRKGEGGGTVVPVTVGNDDYFVVFQQEYSGKGPAYPYTEVRLYAVDWNKAEHRSTVVLEIERGQLYKLDAVLAKSPAQ